MLFRSVDTLVDYYEKHNANIHRAIHQLGIEATEAYEGARTKVAAFINATPEKTVFTRGTTESVNLVRFAWGSKNLSKGDLVVLTMMEHHSNIVPWQLVAKEKGARVAYVGLTADGKLKMEDVERLMGESPKLFAFTHCSNVQIGRASCRERV